MGRFTKYGLVLFFGIVFLGAIVLGPLLYFALKPIFPIPFHRAMDRALLISAVAALALFWSRIPWARLWPLERAAGKRLAFGYLLAAVSAQAMIGLDLSFNGFTSAHLHGHQLEARILMSVVAALLIPPLEETVFRGFVLVELVRVLGRTSACVLAAAIFMLAHFLKIPETLDHVTVHLWSGVNALSAAFQPVFHGAFLDGRGVNLFLIGLILGGIFLRAGSLWINAGLHGGWILALLLFSGLTRPATHPSVSWLGGGDLLSSPLASLVLVLLGLWVWLFYHPPSVPPANGENAR